MSRAARIGVDVGGTFTDIVLALPDGRIHVNKTTTTPFDPGEGVVTGVAAVLAEARGRRFILSPTAGPYEETIPDRMVRNYLRFMESAWRHGAAAGRR